MFKLRDKTVRCADEKHFGEGVRRPAETGEWVGESAEGGLPQSGAVRLSSGQTTRVCRREVALGLEKGPV